MSNPQVESIGDYRVNLELFEGPLDLLLYLIKKNDIDVFDIPIAFITEEYLKYIDAMKEMNIDLAGEFLLMAADLMHVKSRMLLPVEQEAAEEEESDPRADLVRRLLEYQRYKEASHVLVDRNQLNREVFKKQSAEEIPGQKEVFKEGNVYDLIEAFHKILKKLPTSQVKEIIVDRISVNERIFQLIESIKEKGTLSLRSIMPEAPQKHEIVITFLALLEMAKLRIIRVQQMGHEEEIYITGTLEAIDQDDIRKIVRISDEYGSKPVAIPETEIPAQAETEIKDIL